jgi:hypothetical protein
MAGGRMTEDEFLEESRRAARECLDRGNTAGAIVAMFCFAQFTGMSCDDSKRLATRAFLSMGDDIEKVRRFVESWTIHTRQ